MQFHLPETTGAASAFFFPQSVDGGKWWFISWRKFSRRDEKGAKIFSFDAWDNRKFARGS